MTMTQVINIIGTMVSGLAIVACWIIGILSIIIINFYDSRL